MLIRADIRSVITGGGPIPSVVTLVPRQPVEGMLTELPIRIGVVEAASISTGVNSSGAESRPRTPDLLLATITQLDAVVEGVAIVDVRGTTFYATIQLRRGNGSRLAIDCRPSDALALSVRAGAPIFVDDAVLRRASMPDFAAVERESQDRKLKDFHSFVETLSADDFSEGE